MIFCKQNSLYMLFMTSVIKYCFKWFSKVPHYHNEAQVPQYGAQVPNHEAQMPHYEA